MSDINEMNQGLRWYVAHTYSGYENKVKANLEKIVENRGLGDKIVDIRIPTEIVVESDGGKEREVENKIFPAYVLIKMEMSDETWHIVRNIRGVTGFVGPGSKPVPLTDEEAAAIIREEPEVTTSASHRLFIPDGEIRECLHVIVLVGLLLCQHSFLVGFASVVIGIVAGGKSMPPTGIGRILLRRTPSNNHRKQQSDYYIYMILQLNTSPLP